MTASFTHPRQSATPSSGVKTRTALSYDDWCTLYVPVRNPVRSDAAFDGTLFETFGADLAHVLTQPNAIIWTLVQGGDGELSLVNGFCRVDRMGYFVTRHPAGPDEHLEILVA